MLSGLFRASRLNKPSCTIRSRTDSGSEGGFRGWGCVVGARVVMVGAPPKVMDKSWRFRFGFSVTLSCNPND